MVPWKDASCWSQLGTHVADIWFGINTTFAFCIFLVTWCSFISHMQKDHVYWYHFHPNGCLILVFNKGQWARGCGGAVGDRRSAPSVMKRKCQTLTKMKVRAPHPTPASGTFGRMWGQSADMVRSPAFLIPVPGRSKDGLHKPTQGQGDKREAETNSHSGDASC